MSEKVQICWKCDQPCRPIRTTRYSYKRNKVVTAYISDCCRVTLRKVE